MLDYILAYYVAGEVSHEDACYMVMVDVGCSLACASAILLNKSC